MYWMPAIIGLVSIVVYVLITIITYERGYVMREVKNVKLSVPKNDVDNDFQFRKFLNVVKWCYDNGAPVRVLESDPIIPVIYVNITNKSFKPCIDMLIGYCKKASKFLDKYNNKNVIVRDCSCGAFYNYDKKLGKFRFSLSFEVQ